MPNYREQAEFVERYGDEGKEYPEVSFPVAVFGIDEDHIFLGMGQVIGGIEMEYDEYVFLMPVIEIQDIRNGQPLHILGSECFWIHPIPDEVVELVASRGLDTASVVAYLDLLDADLELERAADIIWLDESGIDANSVLEE